MRIALIRHCETLADVSDEVAVGDDSTITNAGISQARAAAKSLRRWRWDGLVTSERQRSIDTGEWIRSELGLPIVFWKDGRLNERSWGEYGRMTGGDWEREFKGRGHPALRSWYLTPTDGESYNDVYGRIDLLWQSLRSSFLREHSLMCVGHGASLKMLRFLIEGGDFWEQTLTHGELIVYETTDRRLGTVESISTSTQFNK